MPVMAAITISLFGRIRALSHPVGPTSIYAMCAAAVRALERRSQQDSLERGKVPCGGG
jgi:hypothetical protein